MYNNIRHMCNKFNRAYLSILLFTDYIFFDFGVVQVASIKHKTIDINKSAKKAAYSYY